MSGILASHAASETDLALWDRVGTGGDSTEVGAFIGRLASDVDITDVCNISLEANVHFRILYLE